MANRDVSLLLLDIVESGDKIISYTRAITFTQFKVDSKTIDAVVRNFAVIGEAANRLPDEFRKAHPEIEWERIRGFRNRIVHDYFGIDLRNRMDGERKFLTSNVAKYQKNR